MLDKDELLRFGITNYLRANKSEMYTGHVESSAGRFIDRYVNGPVQVGILSVPGRLGKLSVRLENMGSVPSLFYLHTFVDKNDDERRQIWIPSQVKNLDIAETRADRFADGIEDALFQFDAAAPGSDMKTYPLFREARDMLASIGAKDLTPAKFVVKTLVPR